MKAIISHDIDHIKVTEHLFKDTIVPKFLIRNCIELATGKITLAEFTLRKLDLLKNKWQNIDELMAFNTEHKIPSSFFIGVQNGLGLSYSQTVSKSWIERIQKGGGEIAVHGIEFESLEKIGYEYSLFKEMSGKSSFGTRMHYVRKNEHTFHYMQQVGYRYDSTEHAFKNPYKIGNMWEFPFQIMDGWVIEKGKRWQTQNLKQAKENSKVLIEKAHVEKLDYIGIDFHDRYFTHSFKTWIDWYAWIVEYLKSNQIAFVNFNEAIAELETKSSI
ncbi:MAG: hypothetical protein IPP32_11700 [Bacteroidetes bacterium]|nr:hypothetical protein [Bacteroidota bacterium]